MQSGKERHIIEKRDASSQRCPPHLGGGGFGGGGCHMHGPMLSHSRGIVAALPKFIKAGFLVKHSRRCAQLLEELACGICSWTSAAGPTGADAHQP